MFNYGNANEAQKEAISATDGLVLITAGPGTGKTFTLVKRAVYLIQECGIQPEQIMMATFTEKAAKELITRITNELAERNISVNVNEMYIGTFHSLCLRIIKENLEFTRLKRNYRLLDTFDQKYLVFRNFHKFKNIEGIDELLSKGGSWKRSDEICTYINHLSEEMVDIEALQSDDNPGIRTLGRVLSVYQEMLEEGNLIDFSTIQTECYKLLMQNKQILEELQDKLQYLMIDEYQDTNYIQEAVAMKLGRKFIGADINLGSIQTTTKRLINVAKELDSQLQENQKYTGFEVYNVNNYDFFRNPLEARDLIIQALEIQPFPQSDVWDGELDGRMVKIMPVNRIATKADLEELKANLPYKTYEKRKADNPTQPVERITIVCMGHEPDLKASLEQGLSEYKLDIEIVDILRDKKDLQLKREAEAEIVKEGSKLVIRSFYPMNLMQKLSLQKEYVEDWRQLVESIMIDWNYDGVVMQPTITDVPDKKEIVSGIYDIPEDAGTIRVKITDLLSESLEMEVE